MMPLVRTTKSVQTPWPVQLFTDENATVKNSLEFGSNAQHTADLLFNTNQGGMRAALKLRTLGPLHIGRGLVITNDIQLHKHLIYPVMENSH